MSIGQYMLCLNVKMFFERLKQTDKMRFLFRFLQ